MEPFNEKEFAFALIEERRYLIVEARRLVFENSDILKEVDSPDRTLRFIDNEGYFHFEVWNPSRQNNKTTFKFHYLPSNRNHKAPNEGSSEPGIILQMLRKWIELVRQYENSRNWNYDPLLEQYESEIREDLFTILDADAVKMPFEEQRQIAIFHFLNASEAEVQKYIAAPEAKEIAEAIAVARDNLGVWNKRKVVSAISKIMGRARKFKLQLYVDLYDTAKKELLKAIVLKSVDIVRTEIIPLLTS